MDLNVERAVSGRCFKHQDCVCENRWINWCQTAWDISFPNIKLSLARMLPSDESRVPQKWFLVLFYGGQFISDAFKMK